MDVSYMANDPTALSIIQVFVGLICFGLVLAALIMMITGLFRFSLELMRTGSSLMASSKKDAGKDS